MSSAAHSEASDKCKSSSSSSSGDLAASNDPTRVSTTSVARRRQDQYLDERPTIDDEMKDDTTMGRNNCTSKRRSLTPDHTEEANALNTEVSPLRKDNQQPTLTPPHHPRSPPRTVTHDKSRVAPHSSRRPPKSPSKSPVDDNQTTTTVTTATATTLGRQEHDWKHGMALSSRSNQRQYVPLESPERNDHYMALSDVVECTYNMTPPTEQRPSSNRHSEEDGHGQPPHSSPLPIPLTFHNLSSTEADSQCENDCEEMYEYYRVVYRGVVGLMNGPDRRNAQKSGSYLSFGEIFASRRKRPREGTVRRTTLSPRASESVPATHEGFESNEDNTSDFTRASRTTAGAPPLPNIPSLSSPSRSADGKEQAMEPDMLPDAICVDYVLTGGYASDTTLVTGGGGGGGGVKSVSSEMLSLTVAAKTPKRSNIHWNDFVTIPDPVKRSSSLGYMFSRQNGVAIVERLDEAPHCESGSFLYRVTASAPVPILTGPAADSPRTKALLLPGSVHEVSLRVLIMGVIYLRLSHRRGWIADRRTSKGRDGVRFIPVVREELPPCDSSNVHTDDGSASMVSSIAVSSVTAPSSAARRRHRPPRRRKDASRSDVSVTDIQNKSLPQHIISGRTNNIASTPSKETASSAIETTLSPTSNMSLLSDDESFDQNTASSVSAGRQQQSVMSHPTSPDASHATSTARSITSVPSSAPSSFFLMRVTAPKGLKILDAPRFQVNNLIHGDGSVSSSHLVSEPEAAGPPKAHQSIFQTMSGRLTSTGPSKTRNPAVFDSGSKARILPRGVLFEASRRMESTGAYNQGAGLIKLSDNSGWAIVPRQDELESQFRTYNGGNLTGKETESLCAFEEVGSALLNPATDNAQSSEQDYLWVQVKVRSGLAVSCPPPLAPLVPDREGEGETSPASSSSSAVGGSNYGPLTGPDSDVASSVGSAFLEAMFRTPKKNRKVTSTRETPQARVPTMPEHQQVNIIPCGAIIQVEMPMESPGQAYTPSERFVRLRGGQGWIPLSLLGKPVAAQVPQPEFRSGSFWFRVQSNKGIKVRLGPSKRAPSIKSEDGVYFRFECGEFLRASEIMTVFSDAGQPVESYAKLYRHRHVILNEQNRDFIHLPSLTAKAEWVQIYSDSELFLQECAIEPRIERHKLGWRYNVVPDSGVSVRRGPSFASEKTGVNLFGGENVVINERVTPAGDKITWLRLKDGQGWVHDVSDLGEQIMIPHSLRHRAGVAGRPKKPPAPKDEIAYKTIVARLFHNDVPDDAYRPPHDLKGSLR